MPQKRQGQVLHWDELYAQCSSAAQRMPIEDVDRELAAMGYDLKKVHSAVRKLGRQASTRSADSQTLARDAGTGERLPVVAPVELIASGGARDDRKRCPAAQRYGKWAVAGAALAAFFLLPFSGSAVLRWFEPHAQQAVASLAGAAKTRARHTASRDKAEELDRAKLAFLKKCVAGDLGGNCGESDLAPAGSNESAKHKNSLPASVEGQEPTGPTRQT